MCTRRHTPPNSVMRYTFNAPLHLIHPPLAPPPPPPPPLASMCITGRYSSYLLQYVYMYTERYNTDGLAVGVASRPSLRRRVAAARETTTRARPPFERFDSNRIDRTFGRGGTNVRTNAVVETRDGRDATRRDATDRAIHSFAPGRGGWGGVDAHSFIPRISVSIHRRDARASDGFARERCRNDWCPKGCSRMCFKSTS